MEWHTVLVLVEPGVCCDSSDIDCNSWFLMMRIFPKHAPPVACLFVFLRARFVSWRQRAAFARYIN
jgi:hypothetical protein